jgi:protein-disulfide isomerase
MPSKQQAAKRRSKAQSRRKRSGPPTYALLGGVAVVALIVVAVIVLLNQGSGTPKTETDATPLEQSLGAANAPVVVAEFADFQCPYCKQFALGPELQLRRDYVDTGKVRFVFRHFPFIGNESTWAAEASECANDQGRFWDYHDKLYEQQGNENSGAFSQDNLKRFAAELGLDTTKFNACLDSGKYQSQVQAAYNEAVKRRVNSTPTILVNGKVIQNGSDYQVLQAAIEAALKGQ